VGVFGYANAGIISKTNLDWIELFGEYLAKKNAILYTGGGKGVLLAARCGCLNRGGSVVSVVPEIGINRDDIDKYRLGNIIASGQGKLGRVHLLAQSIDMGFALGGGAGTLLEVISCYLLAKPVVVVDGFQSKNDPKIINILMQVEKESIDGHSIISGYLDGKMHNQVCPIRICSSSLSPDKVFSIGLTALRTCSEKRHKMG
jgi:uncharacterized protein (TIGR00725 family)